MSPRPVRAYRPRYPRHGRAFEELVPAGFTSIRVVVTTKLECEMGFQPAWRSPSDLRRSQILCLLPRSSTHTPLLARCAALPQTRAHPVLAVSWMPAKAFARSRLEGAIHWLQVSASTVSLEGFQLRRRVWRRSHIFLHRVLVPRLPGLSGRLDLGFVYDLLSDGWRCKTNRKQPYGALQQYLE